MVGGRFAQIVESRPDELSDQPGKILPGGKVVVGRIRPSAILDIVPRRLMVGMQAVGTRLDREVVDAARRDRRGGFRTKQDVLRQAVVGLAVAVHPVVEPGDVENGRKAVRQHVVDLIHATGHRARRVLAVADRLQPRSRPVALGRRLRGHLVAHGPHHHRGVVAEMVHHVDQIAFGPLREIAVIAVPALGHLPLVEGFDHQHQPHLVAELHERLGRHVVRRTDGIAPHLAQHRKLVADGGTVDRRPQRAQVVMQANAPKTNRLAVQEEALVGPYLNRADSEPGRMAVHLLAVDADRRLGRIERRRGGRPQLGMLDRQMLLKGGIMEQLPAVALRGDHTPRPVAQRGLHLDRLAALQSVEPRTEGHRSVIPPDVGSQHLNAPDRNMDRRKGQQPHLAVEPRTGIPARRLRAVFERHDQFILPDMQRLGDFAPEGAVAVGPETDLTPVDQHTGLAHRAVEQQHVAAVLERIDPQRTPVTPLADIGQAARPAGLERGPLFAVLHDGHLLQIVLAREGARDGPVVRNGHRLPAVVLREIVAEAELPVGQQLLVVRISGLKRRCGQQGRHKQRKSFHEFHGRISS